MDLAIQQRMKTAVRVRRDLMETFQYWVKRGFGKLKGAQEIALNDAVKLWVSLAEAGVDVWFGYVETADGLRGYRALVLDEVVKLISELKMTNIRVVQGSMRPPILRALLELKPDKAVVIDGYEKKEIENPEGALDELFKDIVSRGDVELCLIWIRERKIAFFSRERFSIGGEVEYALAGKSFL
jgi:hypothetical protein